MVQKVLKVSVKVDRWRRRWWVSWSSCSAFITISCCWRLSFQTQFQMHSAYKGFECRSRAGSHVSNGGKSWDLYEKLLWPRIVKTSRHIPFWIYIKITKRNVCSGWPINRFVMKSFLNIVSTSTWTRIWETESLSLNSFAVIGSSLPYFAPECICSYIALLFPQRLADELHHLEERDAIVLLVLDDADDFLLHAHLRADLAAAILSPLLLLSVSLSFHT